MQCLHYFGATAQWNNNIILSKLKKGHLMMSYKLTKLKNLFYTIGEIQKLKPVYFYLMLSSNEIISCDR